MEDVSERKCMENDWWEREGGIEKDVKDIMQDVRGRRRMIKGQC